LSRKPEFRVIETRLLSNPEALKLLSKAHSRIMEKEASAPFMIVKTLDYLKKFSKIDPDKAEEIRNILENYGLREESIVMLMNICPRNVDEARILLEYEERFIETKVVEEIVDKLKQYCRET